MKNLIMIVAFAFSVLMVGCSKDDTSVVTSAKSELGISSITISQSTRSLVTSFASGTEDGKGIGVFVNGNLYTPMVARYTFDGTSWNAPGDDASKIFLSNETATVYGFYPSNSLVSGALINDGTSKINVSVPATESSFDATGQIDYMYATAPSADSNVTYPLATATNATATNKQKVDLVFHHALSKLTFVVNRSSSYTGTGTLAQLQLTSGGTLFSTGDGTMNVADGVIALPGTSTNLTFTGSNLINALTAPISTTPTVQALVAPLGSTSSITLLLTVDTKVMSVVLPTSVAASWIPSKNYIYTVTVNGTGLIVNSVTIQDWTDTPSGSVGVS